MHKGSPEILVVRKLVMIIWRFPGLVVPNILKQKDKRTADSFIHIRSNSELDEYLKSLNQ
jgi:hypothetical protein